MNGARGPCLPKAVTNALPGNPSRTPPRSGFFDRRPTERVEHGALQDPTLPVPRDQGAISRWLGGIQCLLRERRLSHSRHGSPPSVDPDSRFSPAGHYAPGQCPRALHFQPASRVHRAVLADAGARRAGWLALGVRDHTRRLPLLARRDGTACGRCMSASLRKRPRCAVRPLRWTVLCGVFDRLPGVVILELCWA